MTLTGRQRLSRATSEAAVQQVVTDALETLGWLWHHETDSRWSRAGLPDLIAVHPRTHEVLFVECKRELGKLRPAQELWADALTLAPGVTYLIARPSTLDEVLAVITRRSSP